MRPPSSALILLVSALAVSAPRAQAPASGARFHAPLDAILDLYVRDGYVYYHALKSDRAALDRYVESLDGPLAAKLGTWPREAQIAFWIDAYNACLLRSVVDNYPIRGRSTEYPPDSLRQVPGVFDRQVRRVAGRALTLDAIENAVLASFKDPRVYFALGRGAVGGGRLRSEAYTGERLEEQLSAVAAEVPTRAVLMQIDLTARRLRVSPIFGWHEAEFISAYAGRAEGSFSRRAPVERAIITFLQPRVTTDELDALKSPDLQVSYLPFDWRLNDLATRR